VDGQAGRLFRIVDFLQSRDLVTARQLADHFAVSERTIRRDLERLQSLDIPVETSAGRGGGIRIRPGALLPPLRFTDDELLALVLGLRLAPRGENDSLRPAAASALRRLEGVLSDHTRARVEALSAAITLHTGASWEAPRVESQLVLDLAEAVHRQHRVELNYQAIASGRTLRQVDPYGLARLENRWYVVGYCHLRRDQRTFRLDRVHSARVTDDTFRRPPAFDPFKAIATSIALAAWPDTITCQARVFSTVERVSRLVPATAVVLEPDPQGVLLTARTEPAEMERLAIHLLGLPFPVEVIRPDELCEAFIAVAKRAAALGAGPAAERA
jgi:predicted DNA-binding transcriptional regulator YafY